MRPTGWPRWPRRSTGWAATRATPPTGWRSAPGRCTAGCSTPTTTTGWPMRVRCWACGCKVSRWRTYRQQSRRCRTSPAYGPRCSGRSDPMARANTSIRIKDYDEDDIRIRPGKHGSKPRTRIRPKHEEARIGRVLTVDRGRFNVLFEDEDLAITAMKARELGRKGVVVGDLVAVVGDRSGEKDTLARIVR